MGAYAEIIAKKSLVDIEMTSYLLDNLTSKLPCGDVPGCDQQNLSVDLSVQNLTSDYVNWEIQMGEPMDPHALPMTVVYVVIFLTGVVGNVCTCVVISRNRYMHTATNYYLFSLAVSDLLLLSAGLPQDVTYLWHRYPYLYGEAFCVVRAYVSETATYASILTITSFTVERYLAICHPIRAHTMSRLSRAVKFILAIWVLSALCAINFGFQMGIIYIDDEYGHEVPESATCNFKRPLDHALLGSTIVFFIVPGTVLCVLYALIGLQLKRSTVMGRKHDGRMSCSSNGSSKLQGKNLNSHGRPMSRKTSSTSRKDVIKMLVAVVIAFFVCWTPFHAQRLMADYIQEPTETDALVFGLLTNVSGFSYYVSATINPILYSILSLKFRQAFRDTLGGCCRRTTSPSSRRSLFTSTLKEVTDDYTVVSEDNGSLVASSSRRASPYKKSTAFTDTVVEVVTFDVPTSVRQSFQETRA